MIFLKRGSGDVLLFIVLAGLMALTVIGISLGLVAFFGEGYDFRTAESDVLAYRVQQCLERVDMFSPDFTLEVCGLDSSVLDEEHLILLEREDGQNFTHGVYGYKESCYFTAAKGKLSYPQCVSFNGVHNGLAYTGLVGSAQVARVVD